MQVIEKVKVVPEGYNGAGMDGMYGRRDVNGKEASAKNPSLTYDEFIKTMK